MSDMFLVVSDRGHVWHVPLKVIAEYRADYYVKVDESTAFDEEVAYAMEDNGAEALDWFLGNMDWDDVVNHARLVETPSALKRPDLSRDDCTIEVRSLPDR